MGIQPVTRPWPMSPPIQLIVPGQSQRSRSGTALQSYEMYPSNLNMKSALLQQQQSPAINSIYQQQQQQHHEYETINQLRNDVKYGLTTSARPPLPLHYNHSQSYTGIRPKSMIEQDQDFKSNYKLITQGMINGQMSISSNQTASPSIRSEPSTTIISRNDPVLRLHSTTPSCVPWLKRIKVIKRIKRGIGLGSSKSCTQFNNLPALRFHQVHGENVQLFNDGHVAKRINSFCKAIAFTDRPVKLNEKICVRLLQVSTNWSGVLRFGLTNQDPSSLKNSLPKYVCPDLTSRPGFWAKAFSDHLVKQGMTINFHVNSSGELIYCIDGEEKGVFLSNVDVRSPLWAIIDVYGNTTAIELVDMRTQLNNSRPPSSSTCTDSPPCSHKFLSTSAVSSPMSTPPSKALMSHSYISTKSLPEPPQSPVKKLTSMSTSVLKSPTLPLQGTSSSSSCQVTSSNTYQQLPVKSTVFQSNSKNPYCSTSSSNIVNNNNSRHFNGNAMTPAHHHQQQNSPSKTSLPVYKTPPAPKRVDDYDYIYSTKCGPSTSSSSNYVSIPSLNVHKIQDCVAPSKYSSPDLKQQQKPPTSTTKSSSTEIQLECLACCERPVDSVFYSCGHMCFCIKCAYCQKDKMGQCPICRADITDVIRIYT